MLFPTVDYGIFFLATLAIAWALARQLRAHKLSLLCASYVFYAGWNWRYVPLLLGLSLFAAVIARTVQTLVASSRRDSVLAVGIVGALGTLVYFKYLAFLLATGTNLLVAMGIRLSPRLPEIALPVGVSFFVFHAISLMVDAWRGKLTRKVTVLDALLYVAFFPQLVAGPILRADAFMPQLGKCRDPSSVDGSRAIWLIVLGLAKKVLIANTLSSAIVDRVFDAPSDFTGVEVLVGVYAYAAQIYCDFSGYTDMATGSALLLGYTFPDNFRSPYLATNVQEFWRRWHVSLSTWLRDYLYVPLGGSRVGERRTQANLMATMLLGGLWHGAAWNFVAWGALHGAALVAQRAWSRATVPWIVRLRTAPTWAIAGRVLTFHFVCFAWVFFRASSWGGIVDVLRSLGRAWHLGPAVSWTVALCLAAGLLGQAMPDHWELAVRARYARFPLAAQGLLFASAVIVIEVLGPAGIPPFIYFQF